MKKITFILVLVIGYLSVLHSQERQTSLNDSYYPAAYYNSKNIATGETILPQTGSANINFDYGIPFPDTGTSYQLKPGAVNALLYDNGPHFNVSGTPNFSRMEDLSFAANLYGFNATYNTFHVADDFTLTDAVIIDKIDVYSYQTGGPSNSINALYVQIWDGDPSSGTATVIWGDRTTNRFSGVVSSNAYRDIESSPGDLSREIQLVTADTPNLTLNPGTYWIEYGFGGIGASGPWAPPIAILGTPNTGNGLQYDFSLNTWAPLLDSGNSAPQGLPFQLDGSPLAFPGVYCGPLEFSVDVEPITRVNILNIDNTSSEVLNGTPEHEDFTAVSTLLEEGESYPIIFEGNTNGNNINRFAVFFDWNQNGILDDAGEVYEITDVLENSTGADGKQAVGNITVPMGTQTGETRMRVKKIFGTTDYLNPCLGADQGQAEDYTVEVVKAGHFPPLNDLCENAIAISCGDTIMGKTISATTDWSAPVCGTVLATSPGVWYVLDDNSSVTGDITVSLCSSNTDFNTKLSIYSGDCTNLICVDSNDDFCGDQSEVTFASDGNTIYYILVHGFDGQTGDFELTVTGDCVIGTPDNFIKGFSFYPNPSMDIVNLESKGTIERVTLYNLLGQSIMENNINSQSWEMDVSALPSGTYLMKVSVDGKTAVYQMVKK